MSLLPVFFKGLTPELIKKAEIELNETLYVREQALAKFKKMILEQNEIHSRLDDIFLLRFLRMKKFDVHKAFNVWRNYYIHRKKHAGKITCLKPSEIKKALNMHIVFYPPYRLYNGSHIVILRIGATDINEISAEDALAPLYIGGELVLECDAAQICGTNLIIDFANATYGHYRQFITISFAKFALDSLQESFPLRVKGIHFVNEPFALHAMLKIVKRIGKKKIVDRMHCHGDDLNSLHRHIPKEFLPEDLGGKLRPQENKDFTSYLFSQEHVIGKMNEYGVVNS